MLGKSMHWTFFSLCAGLACGESASGGATGGGTAETGAEESAGGDNIEPGPNGPGCAEPWEGWWDDAQGLGTSPLMLAEATPQLGRWHGSGGVDAQTNLEPHTADSEGDETLRATLIADDSVFSTGRHLSISWCLGNINPNPRGPGGSIDEELDALNLERYMVLRTDLERATRLWEHHSRMNFIHLAELDDRRKPSGGTCDTALEHVWFRAQTDPCDAAMHLLGKTNAGGGNEFDPAAGSPANADGYDRYLCIAWQILHAGKHEVPTLAEHESGHIVGLQHEHIRWDQGDNPLPNCRDNYPFEPVPSEARLTPPDPWSVMGYPECVGMADSERASPSDWLGAYYLFNWTERRVRDMAPQTGGRDRRLWVGDERPGILWYLPFPDRLLEWRFDAQQPGPLAFEVVERCMDAEAPCSPTDSEGRWHPIMGQFAGSSDALDVFMYSADQAPDVLLRNRRHEGFESFEKIDAPAPRRAIAVVGNFGASGTQDQILWYRPGLASDEMWVFGEDGSHEIVPADVDQVGWQVPLTGHFRSRMHWTDILWFDPRDASIDVWQFNYDFSVLKSGPGSVELLGLIQGTEYLPVVGNFDGDNRTDLFWYAPGSASDWLWLSDSNQQAVTFNSYQFTVDGDYHPIVGDFDGDGDDDLLWYRPAAETDGGSSYLWYFDGPSVEARDVSIQGDYVPYVEDFDGDGCTDIFWYDPIVPGNPSPVWRCLPEQKDFSCDEHADAPKVGYPIGFATGGY
jgi:hypothetical protein